MAIGAIRALNDAGKQVPGDVSVIGFDGLNIGAYTVPRLSTISQSVEELASHSLELLKQNIEDGTSARHETIPVSCILRESVRKL